MISPVTVPIADHESKLRTAGHCLLFFANQPLRERCGTCRRQVASLAGRLERI